MPKQTEEERQLAECEYKLERVIHLAMAVLDDIAAIRSARSMPQARRALCRILPSSEPAESTVVQMAEHAEG